MGDFRPTIEKRSGVLTVLVQADEVASSVDLQCVVDIDDFHEIFGIEILDFQSQLDGGQVADSPPSGYPRWSYDDDIDAAYFKLSQGSARRQKSIAAVAFLTPRKFLVRIEFSGVETI